MPALHRPLLSAETGPAFETKAPAPNGPGGDVSVCHGPGHAPLRVTVTPLRSRGAVAELPWLSTGIPVALVAVAGLASEALC